MTDELTAPVSNEVAQVSGGDVMVVAENSGEMQMAQNALIAWAAAKVETVKRELADAEESLDQATACGLRLNGVKSLVARVRKTLTYYEKVKAALEDGYCIVPEFPVDVVAIRTNKAHPTGMHKSNWEPLIRQNAQALPQGEGDYMNPLATAEWHDEVDEKNYKGEVTGAVTVWAASEFQDVELPIKFMKPRVIEATNRAMLAAVFDEIGILPARPKKDPMIIGRIIDPKGRRLSFLISWFVDSRDL